MSNIKPGGIFATNLLCCSSTAADAVSVLQNYENTVVLS